MNCVSTITTALYSLSYMDMSSWQGSLGGGGGGGVRRNYRCHAK